MAEVKKKKSITDYINSVIDSDGGLKSEVTITMTNETLLKIVGAATGIIVLGFLLKNAFPNKQITQTNQLLTQIKTGLTK